jgi:hypothetical protein
VNDATAAPSAAGQHADVRHVDTEGSTFRTAAAAHPAARGSSVRQGSAAPQGVHPAAPRTATAGLEAARPEIGRPPAAPVLDRRRLLHLAALLPAAVAGLAACGRDGVRPDEGPDPLVALADTARADAALAAAAVAADPALAPRVDPLRAARAEHAAALDAEVVRAGGTLPSPAPTAARTTAPATGGTTAAPAPVVTLARVREAVAASQRGAAQLVPDLPAHRVGLVASVAACCATYAGILT